jgi:hypothetical protein
MFWVCSKERFRADQRLLTTLTQIFELLFYEGRTPRTLISLPISSQGILGRCYSPFVND